MSAEALPFDVVVVGGGPGGYAAAIRAAQRGLRTALVEQQALGGTCLNVGCIPTKALLRSAEVADCMQHEAAALGVHCDAVRLDYARAVQRSRTVVQGLVQGVEGLMRKHRIQVHRGTGLLCGPGRVQVSGAAPVLLQARHIILATGSSPRALPGLPFDGERVISSDEAVHLTQAPARLVIIGAGPIGLEFAGVFRAFGSEVTVVERQPQIAPTEDVETAAVLDAALRRRGIDLRLGTGVEAAQVRPDGVHLQLSDGQALQADRVLVAIGRVPRTAGLGLASVGLQVDAAGLIPVDGQLRTAVPGLLAIGDITPGPMLAHKATHQALLAADGLAGVAVHPIDLRNVPACIYTHPQLASVGLTEAQARAAGYEVKVARFPLRANGKALALGQSEGLIKLVSDARCGEILGAHVVGPEATELIAELVSARTHELTAVELAATMHAHPTLSEAIGEAALGLLGLGLHV